MAEKNTTPKILADNRQARHLYHIGDTFQAGIVLEGWEVKGIRSGRATFNGGGAFIRMKNGEAFLESLTISPSTQDSMGLLAPRQPNRPRKLLLTRHELYKLEKQVTQRGMTIVPLSLTFSGKIKVQLAVARGKNVADKRDTVRERDIKRDIQRQLKNAA